MMVDSIYTENQYDDTATNIIYCKLFPLIMKDFLSRLDCQDMMRLDNLLVPSTAYSVSPTLVVSGTSQVTPIYNGGYANPGAEALVQQRDLERMKGGLELEAPQITTEQIMGF